MPSPPLLTSLLDTLDTLTDGLIGGQLSAVEWHNAVARELFAHHLATYADAVGKDERDVLDAVKRIVGAQIDYLNGFTDQVEAGDYEDRPDALKARAAMYAGSVKQSYWAGKTDGYDLPAYPGDGSSECLGNCGCAWDIRDDGAYWVRGKDDSCATCVQRADDWTPYQGGNE